MIEFATDGIYINDEHGEIVSWVEDEWIEDSEVVFAIANAIQLYYVIGPEALRRRIGRRIT